MNLRHVAALALVGWYLMRPPPGARYMALHAGFAGVATATEQFVN